MITPEMVSIIKDNENCNDHGKGTYMQMVDYVSYDGEYDANTNTFTYNPDASHYTDSGEIYWICGHCDRTIDWVVDHPQAEAL